MIDREQIEALDRQSGCAGEVPARFIRAEVPRTDGLRITGWIPLEHVDLVANLSASDWQAGLDGALLRVTDGVPHDHLEVRQTHAALGEPIWLYGYPYATNRASSALSARGYENANQSLRVSMGRVTQEKGVDFVADADGISGDSGGAVVDGQTAEARVTSLSGGDIIVHAADVLQRLLRLSRRPAVAA